MSIIFSISLNRRILQLTLAAACWLGMSSSTFAIESFITVDQQTGLILSSKNSNEKRQVASLTKIATAVVALDAAELKIISMGELATVPAEATTTGGANLAGLQEGDTLSIRDLLYCSLLASDNIAATTIAHHIGRKLANPTRLDPTGNFVAHMNSLARNLKMKRTIFLNPSGIEDEKTTLPASTAADIARLCRYALADSDFRFYVSQKTRQIEVHRNGAAMSITLKNTNRLLGEDGIDGVKTGTNTRAGFCLALSSWKTPEIVRHADGVVQTPRRIITVLLGADGDDSRFSEGLQLIRQGWGAYQQWANKGRPVTKKECL